MPSTLYEPIGAGPGQDRADRIDADDRARSGSSSLSVRATPVIVPPVPAVITTHVELAAGLLEDLLAGALVVRERVVGVRVLIEDVRVGQDLLQLLARRRCGSRARPRPPRSACG